MSLFHPDIPFVPSPHFSSREGMTIEGTILHYTAGGSTAGTVQWFQDPASKASSHFVLSREGKFTQMVALDQAAWHAGASEMKYRGQLRRGANRFTLGIEICNHGLLYRDSQDRFWYELAGGMKPYKQAAKPKEATLVFESGHTVSGWWEPYTDAQVDALMWLIQELQKRDYKSAVSTIVGHEEICVPAGRKIDVGPLFPWRRFNRGVRATKAIVDGTEV